MENIPCIEDCGNCAHCPLVKQLIGFNERASDMAENIGTAALSEDTEELAASIFSDLPEGVNTILGPHGLTDIESADDIAQAFRSGTSSLLDNLDTMRDFVREKIEELTLGCEGPLKMRAAKSGQLVTVTVCVSPVTPNGINTEPTTVYRQPADK